MRIMAENLGFPEGPVAMADGSVILTEIAAGRVSRVAGDGALSVVSAAGGGPNGLAIGPDGALYCCDNGGSRYVPGHFMGQGPSAEYQGGCIRRIDLAGGENRILYSECAGQRLSAPNDLVFDKAGGFYFTDLGKRYARTRDHGGLYYAQPDGSRITEIAHPIVSPNGVGLSPDERTLYVADTEAARLWAFDIAAPGVLRKQGFPSPHGGRLVAGLGGFARFDSLAVQANGDICVATLVAGCITVISPDGTIIRQIEMPDTHPTNICFGGADLRTAYISLSETGRLGSMPWADPGHRLNFAS